MHYLIHKSTRNSFIILCLCLGIRQEIADIEQGRMDGEDNPLKVDNLNHMHLYQMCSLSL